MNLHLSCKMMKLLYQVWQDPWWDFDEVETLGREVDAAIYCFLLFSSTYLTFPLNCIMKKSCFHFTEQIYSSHENHEKKVCFWVILLLPTPLEIKRLLPYILKLRPSLAIPLCKFRCINHCLLIREVKLFPWQPFVLLMLLVPHAGLV